MSLRVKLENKANVEKSTAEKWTEVDPGGTFSVPRVSLTCMFHKQGPPLFSLSFWGVGWVGGNGSAWVMFLVHCNQIPETEMLLASWKKEELGL